MSTVFCCLSYFPSIKEALQKMNFVRKMFLALFLTISFNFHVSAQTSPIKSAGNITSVSISGQQAFTNGTSVFIC